MILDLIKEKLGVYPMGDNPGIQKNTLLYLVKFGSNLYGTNTENSDTDYKGIYKPSFKNLALGRVEKTLSLSTGDDKSKNTAEDIDIELFSLDYWLVLLEKGETIALDMLFSFTNKEAVAYKDPYMDLFFNNVDKLVDSEQVKTCAYIGYAKSQSVKYGLKGTRMKALEKASEYFCPTGCELEDMVNDSKLSDYMFAVVEHVNDINYCDIRHDRGLDFLYLCGKMHQSTITVREFLRRVNLSWKVYGERSKLAMENEGVDWKALSHCMRAIYQTQDLMENGKITYPLSKADIVLNIKLGKLTWPEVEGMIESGLEYIENMPVNFETKWVQDFVDRSVLTIYDLKGE